MLLINDGYRRIVDVLVCEIDEIFYQYTQIHASWRTKRGLPTNVPMRSTAVPNTRPISSSCRTICLIFKDGKTDFSSSFVFWVVAIIGLVDEWWCDEWWLGYVIRRRRAFSLFVFFESDVLSLRWYSTPFTVTPEHNVNTPFKEHVDDNSNIDSNNNNDSNSSSSNTHFSKQKKNNEYQSQMV